MFSEQWSCMLNSLHRNIKLMPQFFWYNPWNPAKTGPISSVEQETSGRIACRPTLPYRHFATKLQRTRNANNSNSSHEDKHQIVRRFTKASHELENVHNVHTITRARAPYQHWIQYTGLWAKNWRKDWTLMPQHTHISTGHMRRRKKYSHVTPLMF